MVSGAHVWGLMDEDGHLWTGHVIGAQKPTMLNKVEQSRTKLCIGGERHPVEKTRSFEIAPYKVEKKYARMVES